MLYQSEMTKVVSVATVLLFVLIFRTSISWALLVQKLLSVSRGLRPPCQSTPV